jgi:peroxiredoxin
LLDQVEIYWQKNCRECLKKNCSFREEFELYRVCQKRRTGVSVAQHNKDPDFIAKTVMELSVKKKSQKVKMKMAATQWVTKHYVVVMVTFFLLSVVGQYILITFTLGFLLL